LMLWLISQAIGKGWEYRETSPGKNKNQQGFVRRQKRFVFTKTGKTSKGHDRRGGGGAGIFSSRSEANAKVRVPRRAVRPHFGEAHIGSTTGGY